MISGRLVDRIVPNQVFRIRIFSGQLGAIGNVTKISIGIGAFTHGGDNGRYLGNLG